MLINYKIYCENRIKDLEKFKDICVGMPGIDTAINSVKDCMKLTKWTENIVKVLEKYLGRELHPAEADMYVQLLAGYAASQLTAKEQLDITSPEDFIPIISKYIDKILPGFYNKKAVKLSTNVMKKFISIAEGAP